MSAQTPRPSAEKMSTADVTNSAAATLIELIRNGVAQTRPQLEEQSGLGRKVVTQRIADLQSHQFVVETGFGQSAGGRKARTLSLNADKGHVIAAIIGSTELIVAAVDLTGRVRHRELQSWNVDRGPNETMERLTALIRTVSRKAKSDGPWAISLGVPGPVEFSTGRIVSPPIMPGWNDFNPRSWLRNLFDCPVWVDNLAHLMAFGEWHASPMPRRDMLFIEVGVDVGAGMVFNGRLLRGDRGGAGAIGHIPVAGSDAPCRCGRRGCLEAVAGGWAISDRLTHPRKGDPPRMQASDRPITLGDVGAAAADHDPFISSLLQEAARAIGSVTADLVNFSNPGVVVLGGGVLETGDLFFQPFAEQITRRSTDLVTQDLVIRPSTLVDDNGIAGASRVALDGVLNFDAVSRWLPDGSPVGHSAVIQRLHHAV